MKTTIVMPTYNEAINLPKIVEIILQQPIEDLNILVVDDNSPDGTGNLAEELKISTHGKVQVMHREGKQGLGSAYRQGFLEAISQGADYVGQMDSDFSHPADKLPEMVKLLSDYDLVIGSRYVEGGKLDESWPFWRKALSGFGNWYARTILQMPVQDATGGFKIWQKEVIESIPLDKVKSNGYVFQVEMNYLAYLSDFKITEIPIYFADRRWGESKMNFRIQIEAAFRTWKLLSLYRDLRKNKTKNRRYIRLD